MKIIELDEKLLITSTIDGILKYNKADLCIYLNRIFNFSGELKGALNINHPLPVLWDITFTKKEENKKKLIYAFKIIDII